MKSPSWKPSAARVSPSDINGMSTGRTMTRAEAMASRTERLLKPTSFHRVRRQAATAAGSTTSPSWTAPSGRAISPMSCRRGGLPGAMATARTALVPTSSPITVPLAMPSLSAAAVPDMTIRADQPAKSSAHRVLSAAPRPTREMMDSTAATRPLDAADLAEDLFDLSEQRLDPAIVGLLPEQMARRYRAIPIRRDGRRLVVGMTNPGDLAAVDDLRAVLREPFTRVDHLRAPAGRRARRGDPSRGRGAVGRPDRRRRLRRHAARPRRACERSSRTRRSSSS